jgi:pseudouridine-5'-phosphate glycosidase
VTVLGYRTDYFPLFHCRDSQYRLNLRVESPEEVVEVLKEKRRLGIKGGILVANPIPEESAIGFEEINHLVEKAVSSAREDGIGGKALTPYLLSKISSLSNGKTLSANISLLINNAALGGKIAASQAWVV